MMGGDAASLPEGIGATDLAAAVHRAMGSDTAALGTWEVRRISEPRVATTMGVYAVAGVASDRGVLAAWSFIIKLLAPTPAGSPPREADLYRSGALACLSGGLRALRCFGVVDLPGGGAAVWLAPVRDTLGTWPVTRFGLAAHHLGEFSATQTQGGPLPLWNRLPRLDWRPLVASGEATIAQVQESAAHPLLRRACPPPVVDGFARLWAVRDTLVANLECAPIVVSHGDAQRRNLFADGDWHTVTIDWSNAGLRPVGADLVTLVHQALAYFDVDMDAAAGLDREGCEQYCAGLARAGLAIDPAEVRFAYQTQLALCLDVLELGWAVRIALHETRHRRVEAIFGRPLHEILDRRAAIATFLLARACNDYAYVGVVP
jgi:hypothetical protein